MAERVIVASPVLVGRDEALMHAWRRLGEAAAGAGQLLFVAGEAGIGKTRLAIEVARDLVGSYADGVWLVELAPLSETISR